MLRETLGVMRELPRLHEIATVFVRHGLGEFVQRIGVAGVLERAGRIVHWGEASESVKLEPAQRIEDRWQELMANGATPEMNPSCSVPTLSCMSWIFLSCRISRSASIATRSRRDECAAHRGSSDHVCCHPRDGPGW